MTAAPDSTTTSTVRVGLLQCGHVRADVATDHGDYPELFEQVERQPES